MEIIVAGNAPSKRIEYFVEAGRKLETEVRFLTYGELFDCLPQRRQAVVKLEPWVSSETGFLEYARLNEEYQAALRRLDGVVLPDDVHFLNAPHALLQALDKKETKRILAANALNATPLLGAPHSYEELAGALSDCPRGCFLKPRYGSGAGGVMAIRHRPHPKGWVAYTTLQAVDGVIRNTKRIQRLTKEQEIRPLAETVMRTGAVLEEWIPKEQWQGENYDLRVVCGQTEVQYVVVRCSKGCITNLHLNNKARLWDELALPEEVCRRIFLLCRQAVRAMDLQYAGVDVLIERGTGTPYIIEVNGQGDHIYQDMYAGNSIYAGQIKTIKNRYDHADR